LPRVGAFFHLGPTTVVLPLLFCEMLSYGGLVADNDHLYLSSIGAINRMKREWTDLEFADWTLLPSEAALLANKTGPTRLGFAVLLKFFQYAARFPLSMQQVPATAVASIGKDSPLATCIAATPATDVRSEDHRSALDRKVLQRTPIAAMARVRNGLATRTNSSPGRQPP
jgi:hypothetical protein